MQTLEEFIETSEACYLHVENDVWFMFYHRGNRIFQANWPNSYMGFCDALKCIGHAASQYSQTITWHEAAWLTQLVRNVRESWFGED